MNIHNMNTVTNNRWSASDMGTQPKFAGLCFCTFNYKYRIKHKYKI